MKLHQLKHTLITAANKVLRFAGITMVDRRVHEAFTMRSVLDRIRSANIPVNGVFDLGAAEGDWSRLALCVFPQAVVFGVDPLIEREKNLRALQEQDTRFRYSCCAAGNVDEGSAKLNVTADLDGSTVDEQATGSRNVPTRTLDSLAAQHHLPPPYLLKFDTHGYEVPILEGASAVLAQTNVIIMEVYNFEITKTALRFHETCAKLETLGFRCADLADPMLREHDKTLWQMDLVFIRADSPRFAHLHYR